ncbi:hypothetical protein HPC49_04885 [Pyxidicoccus fallax]|uniref:Uncharacterized protein n=1 Tax=Pyxidicoccus fallax TaxID=394095 RepID=A0A848L6R2_9BACT|nr:hypothetical protein [Pyxidicoccus fallax]NMO14419.1 hypothetical protein [Pyxidicoccus fallax]NPC77586.1 hypothetical protein [Pyxidicoccus fallax]
MENAFRGVVHSGCFIDERNLALVVSHPHPDNDHGGGPGPVEDWREPYDFDAYAALVDPDFDPDDARFEVDEFRHVALCTAGKWTLEELPGSGTLEALRRLESNQYGALLSYGGSAFFAAFRASDSGRWDALEHVGLPASLIEKRACFSDADVVLAGSRAYDLDSPSEVGLLVRGDGVMTWTQSFGQVPGRVLALDSCLAEDGTRVLYAGGRGLWMYSAGQWHDIHPSLSGEVAFLRCFPTGEVVAGTTRGDVIAGTGAACRVVARVGPIHSAERWGGHLYVADSERVYRLGESGFERCAIPAMDSVGNLPSVGRLSVGAGRLWLAGSHVLASSADGRAWTTHPVR